MNPAQITNLNSRREVEGVLNRLGQQRAQFTRNGNEQMVEELTELMNVGRRRLLEVDAEATRLHQAQGTPDRIESPFTRILAQALRHLGLPDTPIDHRRAVIEQQPYGRLLIHATSPWRSEEHRFQGLGVALEIAGTDPNHTADLYEAVARQLRQHRTQRGEALALHPPQNDSRAVGVELILYRAAGGPGPRRPQQRDWKWLVETAIMFKSTLFLPYLTALNDTWLTGPSLDKFADSSARTLSAVSQGPPPKRGERGQCPVCDQGGLEPGQRRHKRCEHLARIDVQSHDEPAVAREPKWAAEYRRLVAVVEQREAQTYGRRVSGTARPVRIPEARRAVLARCDGRCENPECTGQPSDVTDEGNSLLEVDHVDELGAGGRDHPSAMVALCPNCHAIKTRGRSREQLTENLRKVADRKHADSQLR